MSFYLKITNKVLASIVKKLETFWTNLFQLSLHLDPVRDKHCLINGLYILDRE